MSFSRRIAFALGVGALIYVGVEPTEDIVWQLPFVLALLVMLAIGWAVIAASQAVRLAHAGKQFGFDQIAPTAR